MPYKAVQPAKHRYQMPPRAIAELIDRPPTPAIRLSPDQRWMLIMEQPSLPGIADLAQPELRLAGLRINPRTNGPSRASYLCGLRFLNLRTQRERAVAGLPQDARIGLPLWSPDSRHVAFTITSDRGIALYVANVRTGRARRLTKPIVNGALGRAWRWLPSSDGVVCKIVLADRGDPPEPNPVPTGPVIQQSLGETAPTRTYQDLLQNAHDEALFDYYASSRLAIVTLRGKLTPLRTRGIIVRVEPSPDGKYFLVESVHRPYSYLVPLGRFPRAIDVWSAGGRRVARMADVPLAETIPLAFDSVREGRRKFTWRADAPATLCWAEAQDGGDMKRAVDVHDRLYMQAAPFRGQPVALARLALRFNEIQWADDHTALVWGWRWQDRRYRCLVVNPATRRTRRRALFDGSWEDRYNDPGSPHLVATERGTYVIKLTSDRSNMFMIGDGASPDGDRPFVDRLNIRTGKATRLWRCDGPYYERPVRVLDDGERLFARRESKTEPPNYFIRQLDTGQLSQVTRFPHPHPELDGVTKELIRYRRSDGVMLTATLYTPPGYTTEQGRLPLIVWAYPAEFKSADAAGQVTDSPHRFSRVGWWSPMVWLLRGYAVLDDPGMPIVGEGDAEPNDSYIKQLVASAKAAVKEVVRRGVVDRKRIAVGGHSYGAFMTANLLAHTDLFRAGVARSGAYNRTLTPFGFQAEERTLWQAPRVYHRMSPFMQADKIKRPLLLIHGDADNNMGTFPLQSRRLYQALKGLGGTTRLVMLPHESHSYRARESIMHMLWETDTWLATYVTPAPGSG